MKRILLLSFTVLCQTSFAQDAHFSQYYASQSSVNPATTGMFSGDMRVSGLYRQQWPQYGTAFVTGSFAAEWKPKGFRDGENVNRMAIGGVLVYDKTPDGVLRSEHAYAMIAYHKALDEFGHSRLGLGFMAGYNQKSLDVSQLTFGNQFGSGGFTGGSPGEVFSSSQHSSFDVHAGLLYSYEDEGKLFYFGGAVYHLLKPQDYFLVNSQLTNEVPHRFNIHAGMNINNGHLQYAASLLIMRQQNSNEAMAGGAIGFPFGDDGILYTGTWYRLGESLIPTINLQYGTMNIGLSYDTFFNNNKTAVRPRSFELSLAYRLVNYHDNKTGCFAF